MLYINLIERSPYGCLKRLIFPLKDSISDDFAEKTFTRKITSKVKFKICAPMAASPAMIRKVFFE